jgi:hypothetical protein
MEEIFTISITQEIFYQRLPALLLSEWPQNSVALPVTPSLSYLSSSYTRVKRGKIFTTTTTYILAPSDVNSVPPHSLHGHLKEKLMDYIIEI